MSYNSELTDLEYDVLNGLDGINGSPKIKSPQLEMGASDIRRHFLERMSKLPSSIQQALREGTAHTSSSPYYSTAEMKGTSSELIRTSVPEEIGITNIDNGKLGKDRHLTLSGIQLLFDANSINGEFINPFPADLLNGEWELELKGKKIFVKEPIRKFTTGVMGYQTDIPFGYYKLDHPKQVEPMTSIEFNVKTANPVKGFLKVLLHGTVVHVH